MPGHHCSFKNLLLGACSVGLLNVVGTSIAAETPTPAKPAKAAKKPVKQASKKQAQAMLQEANSEQLEAAKLVYYGHYECEFKQFVDVSEDGRNPGYVDVKLGKKSYVMKPVLSSTGALRLEDVKGATVMVQIANKSMLLDVKAGHRLVDDCVSPKQRELMEAAAKAKEVQAAGASASAANAAVAPASGPASAPGSDMNAGSVRAPASDDAASAVK